jgi:hypothetical protein
MASEKLRVDQDQCKRYDHYIERLNIVIQTMSMENKMFFEYLLDLKDRVDAVEKVLSDYIDDIEDEDEDEDESPAKATSPECSCCKEENLSLKEIQDCIQDLKAIFVAYEKVKK